MLLDEDSENYDLFSVAEKDEFLYRLFSHFCLGGSVCQYEDTVEPYVSITKGVYKDLLSVNKDPQGGLYIASHVFKIKAKVTAFCIFHTTSQTLAMQITLCKM